MAEFTVNTNAVKTTADAEERLRKELADIQQMVRQISGSLVIKTAASASIKMRLNGLAGRVGNHQNSMRSMKNALERAANLYEEAERNICRYTEDGVKTAETKTLKTGSSFWNDLTDLFGKITGKIGEIVQDLFSSITTAWSNLVSVVEGIIGKGDVTDSQPTAAWVSLTALPLKGAAGTVTAGGATDSIVSSITASGAPKYNQPDYTQKDLAPDTNGIYGPYVYHRDGSLGRVCEWNIEGQQLSCTYYTLRKLNERGLSYPCTGGPGNGSQWYTNFDRESGLPNYDGNNALVDLANNLTLPQENIVVSFAGGPALTLGDGTKIIPGHVLLIDEIYRDGNGNVKVKYSDMFYSEPGMGTKYITSLNGKNPQVEKTLEDFMSSYNKSNGNINGVAVIGAGS